MRFTPLLVLPFLSVALCGVSQTTPAPADLQQHLYRAQQFMHENRPDLAIPELEAAVKLDPANLDAQANLGVLQYFKGDAAQAIPHLRAALQTKSDLWKIQALLGLAEMREKDAAAGRADLTLALPHLKGEKVQREAGDALVQSYVQTGELDKAVAAIGVLLEANPTDPGLLLNSYRFYAELANNAMITLALSAPNSAELHVAMGQELARHGQDEAAIANYRAAIALNPKLPGAHTELGGLLYDSMDQKLRDEAAAEFRAAIALDPQNQHAHLMLGEDAARHGDLKTAYAEESRAVELAPDDPDACIELAKTLIDMDQKEQARKLLVHALQIDNTNETAHYRLSRLDRQMGKVEDAKKEIAEYQKYKEMKAKLRSIFRDMRLKVDEKAEDEGGMGK